MGTIRLIRYNPVKYNTLFSVRREIESLSVIRHPNIVRYHGVFVEDGLIKGLYLDQYDFTLDHMLQTGVEFDRMKFFKHLVVAVDYIRELGFVHGDIHVENIMVKKEDTSFPYLIDFDACEKVGTKIIETTKTFGEKRSDIITYGCDSSLLIDVFETLFPQ
ncbi:hypothetical protein GGF46_004973 [Coemansia sp. RSA 552]|nr:hypothetical protein GGF46_004973 [Coemansia sp. RSA 552]